jgi:lipopolysaccharide export system permease protein
VETWYGKAINGEKMRRWIPGILDWYIIRKFLMTFVVTLIMFVLIILLFDIGEKLDDFLEKNAPVKAIVFDYYLNYIPFFLNTFSPVFIFVAVIYFTSRLAMRSEFISMLAGGISFRRILYPYMLASLILAAGSYYLNGWVIPQSDKKRVAFENRFTRGYWTHFKGTIYRQLKPGVLLYMEYFNNNDSTGGGVSLEQFQGTELKSVTFAQNIHYQHKTNKWRLQNVKVRSFNPDGSQELQLIDYIDTALAFNPSDFFFKAEDVQSLDMAELKEFIAKERERGAEGIETFETELYRRYATPFSTFILSFIGVCVAGRKVRGGLGLHLGIGIFIIIFYLFVSKYFISMGATRIISPMMSVWLPNLIFTAIGLFFYRTAQK